MTFQHAFRLTIVFMLVASLIGCNMPAIQNLPDLGIIAKATNESGAKNAPIATALPPPAETLISFVISPPPDTPSDETFYFTLLDEVTGLALNAQPIPMEAIESTDSSSPPPGYMVTLPFALGSVVKYRYERQSGSIRVAEHLSDGSAVRYRMVHVTGQSTVKDVISRWTDTSFTLPTGRIDGTATDSETLEPIANLLVTAGGAQTLTSSDGYFMLEGLPVGVHNLVGYSLDGAYQTFQQGAQVAEGATTPSLIQMDAAINSNIIFVVKVPDGTLPVVPLRLAGNLFQLGNTFADLAGGVSSLASNMPVLKMLPDGRYTITAALPIGADIRYKYTLGDGYWNAEHSESGDFMIRQLIVPDHTVLVEDKVETWFSSAQNPITFDLTVPQNTPMTDFASIQFRPLFGWTESIPMWSLGGNRWAYVLYSPLNLPGGLSYRFCRNNQCGIADDIETAGPGAEGRPVELMEKPQTLSTLVKSWAYWPEEASFESLSQNLPTVENVTGYGDGYWAGFEISQGYRPSWSALIPQAFSQMKIGDANTVVITPSWTYGRRPPGNELPILAPLPGQDPSWFETTSWIQQAHTVGLKPVLRPVPNFLIPANEWWSTASRDESWWQVWFEQYRTFLIHHADLAAQSGVSGLILGGEWLQPALPGVEMPDGSATGLPDDAEIRWRSLLTEVRSHFSGQILWALPYQDLLLPPPFLDLIDMTYVELPVSAGGSIDESLGQDLASWLDVSAMSYQYLSGKPLIIAAACPSNPDLQTQTDCFQSLLTAVNSRNWISGFISLGYYPAAALQGQSSSVNGKPASALLQQWFSQVTQ